VRTERDGRRTVELWDVQTATERAKVHIDEAAHRAERLLSDPDTKARREAVECRWCFYGRNGMSGQAFTEWTCGACGEKASHPNTRVPRLCAACAKELHLCRQCCADVELRRRRTL